MAALLLGMAPAFFAQREDNARSIDLDPALSGLQFSSSGMQEDLVQLIARKSTASKTPTNGANPQIIEAGFLAMRIVTTGSTCGYNNGSFQVFASGGTPPYTYSANGGAFQSGSLFDSLTAGTYLVVVKDATGLTITSMANIVNTYPLPSLYLVNYSVPTPCKGTDGTVTIAGSGGTPPYMYSDDGVHWQSSGTFTNLPSAKVGTIFLVRDADGCIQTYPFRFYSSHCSLITCQLYTGISPCGHDGVISVYDLNGGISPYTFSLDGSHYQSAPSFSDLGPGIYTVYVKDATGTLLVFSCQLFTTCALSMNVSKTDANCGANDGSITVSALYGAAPYLYSLDGINFQLSNQFGGLAPGNYSVYVRDANSVITATYNVLINSACPTVTLTETDAHCGKGDGSILAIGAGGASPYTYSLDGVNFQTGDSFPGLTPGNYKVVIKDSKGLSSSSSITVNNDCLVLQVSETNATCGNNDGSLLASAANGQPPYQYSIDGLNFFPGGAFGKLGAGNYVVIAKDAAGVLGRDSVTIGVINNMKINITTIPASCADTGATLTIAASGGGSPLAYSIDSGMTFSSSNFFTNLDTGLYKVVVQDPSGCRLTDSAHISALPGPGVKFGVDTTICDGQTFQLDATNPGATYLWNNGSTGPTLLVNQSGNYSVTISANGCTSTDSIAVYYTGKPAVQLPRDTSVCLAQQLVLDATYAQSTYLWQDGSSQSTYKVTLPGIYIVQVKNECGFIQDTVNVSSNGCTCKFYMPNAFTPNNDGLNDVFRPKYQCSISSYHLRIFNRLGQLVFSTQTPSTGWDGTMGGIRQPSGVYVWEMSYGDAISGMTTLEKGTVVLIR